MLALDVGDLQDRQQQLKRSLDVAGTVRTLRAEESLSSSSSSSSSDKKMIHPFQETVTDVSLK